MDNNSISESTQVARCTDPITAEVDGEIVMMSVEQGHYYGLDSVGSQIWALLDEPLRVSELIDRLLEQYNVDRETCLRETMEFLSKMAGDGLLEVHNE